MTGQCETVAVGLIGRGISASASPAIHEREAASLGLPLTYRLIDFDRLGLPDEALGTTLNLLAGIGLAGVNVTHPFKQAVIPLLDEVDRTAAALGAVNCVRFRNGRKLGSNSDWIGFRWLMESALPGVVIDRVAQIGAGGAGSASAYCLLTMGAREIAVYDPNAGSAQALAERLSKQFSDAFVSVCSSPAEALREATGVVQSTPVGMAAHPGLPFDPELLRPEQWLADVIYFPRETALVRAAREKGLRAVTGEAMVIGQAAEPFRLFTGRDPDRDRMMREFRARDRLPAEKECAA